MLISKFSIFDRTYSHLRRKLYFWSLFIGLRCLSIWILYVKKHARYSYKSVVRFFNVAFLDIVYNWENSEISICCGCGLIFLSSITSIFYHFNHLIIFENQYIFLWISCLKNRSLIQNNKSLLPENWKKHKILTMLYWCI